LLPGRGGGRRAAMAAHGLAVAARAPQLLPRLQVAGPESQQLHSRRLPELVTRAGAASAREGNVPRQGFAVAALAVLAVAAARSAGGRGRARHARRCSRLRWRAGRRQTGEGRRCAVVLAATAEADTLSEVSLLVSNALAGQSPDKALTVLATLAAAIVCHEAGHFLCARSVGLRAQEFALGFGPEVVNFGEDAGGTSFVLRAFPVGGYVRFDEAKTVKLKDGEFVNEFEAMPAPARLWVLAGGVMANMVAAYTSLTAAAITVGVPKKEPLPGIRVESVGEEAFARTGLEEDDVLLRVGSMDLNTTAADVRETVDFIRGLPAQSPVQLLVERGSEQLRLDAMPLTDPETGMQRLGVMINSNTQETLVKAASLPEAGGIAGEFVSRLLGEQVKALQNLVSGSGPGEVVGPVGIVRQGEELASAEGLIGLGIFFVTVNLNLALVNALPVPALDGGKAAFVLLEQVIGTRVDERKKEDLELTFVFIVIVALLSLTAKDIAKIFEQ